MLFGWLRMPFGCKNDPQIYQRLINNAVYGYMKIGTDQHASSIEPYKRIDVFTEGDSDTSQTPSVLG